ncbi:MAG: hypothetical protein LW821_11475 [Flammeovirgaceae bacterium]|nr:hypothetical protein [Flammeovirgaceae bacterium]
MARLLLLLIFIATHSFAQQGHPFLSHFSPTGKNNVLCFDFKQAPNGLFYSACREGVFQFDGRNWQRIEVKESIYTLLPEADRIWVAGDGFAGYLTKQIGKPGFTLKKTGTQSETAFTAIKSDEQFIYFIAENEFWQTHRKTLKTTKLKVAPNETILTVMPAGKTYIPTVITDSTSYQIKQTSLIAAPEKFESVKLITALNNNWFALRGNNQFYVGTPDKWSVVSLADLGTILQSIPVTLIQVSAEVIAIGTVHNGIYLVNTKSGKTEEHIHYGTGLPDNEIFCLTKDQENNIWAAHELGFTQISTHIPLQTFSHYPGLQGNVQTTAFIGSTLYVGTSTGLYKLQPRKTTLEWLEPVRVPNKTDKSKTEQTATTQPTEPTSKKKGFFSFLKRKKEEKATQKQNATTEQPLPNQEKIIYVKRTIEQADGFEYKKEESIQTKISFLLAQPNQLFAAGPAGLYQITSSQKPRLIFSDPIEFASTLANNQLILQNESGTVFLCNPNGKTQILFSTAESIQSATENNAGVWLVGIKTLYHLDADFKIKTYKFSNTQNDATAIISLNDVPVMCNADGYFLFNNRAVRVIDSLAKANLFFASANIMVTKRENQWSMVGHNQANTLNYLNLVPEIRKLIVEKNTNTIWVVSVNNELYSLKLQNTKNTSVQYPLLVKSVIHNKNYLPQTIRKFEFIQSEQLFNMDVSRPFFANAKDVEYRYWLEGLEGSDFSAWSANSVINFTFLPLGKYKLHVQTRDALHEQSIDEIFEIIVKPPLWKTPWFYASQFVLFGLLVLVSIRLKMNRRYKIFAQLLSVLTIVLLITFIQTVFSTYLSTSSPVIDFCIQVGIALLVLPIELYLRKLMASDVAAEKLKSIINNTQKNA